MKSLKAYKVEVAIWAAHWIVDLLLVVVPLLIIGRFSLSWWSAPLLALIALGLFNQFTYLHEASHRSLGAPVPLQLALGRVAGVVLLFPLHLWTEHHAIHHRSTHILGHDNAFHPVRTTSWFMYSMSLLFRTLLIGLSLPITALLCFTDQLRRNRRSNRILRPSRKVLRSAAVDLSMSLALAYVILLALGWKLFLVAWILPLLLAHTLFSSMSLLHHLHPENPFRSEGFDGDRIQRVLQHTNHLLFPSWFHLLTHNVHYHLAHHIWPSSPYYELRQKTAELLAWENVKVRELRFSIAHIFEIAQSSSVKETPK